MEPLRIIHVLGSLEIGGVQAMLMNLYRKIDRSKIQFDFILDHASDKMFFSDEVKELGGKIYRFPSFTGSNYLQIKKVWNVFFREHPEYKVLHSHIRSYAALYLPIAKKYGVKTIIHSHSTSNGAGIKSIAKKLLQYPLRYQADFYMGCSMCASKWLFGKKVVNSDRYFTIPNAIDPDIYKFNCKTRAEKRKELGVEEKQVYMHIGRLHPAKNHEFLIECFEKIHQKESNAVLIIVGDGPLRENIEIKVGQSTARDCVRLLGNRSDISELLQAADCFLFPSKWEGLPVTVVEAQAAGIPCLISNIISNEVCITPCVCMLPINRGTTVWVEAALSLSYNRRKEAEQAYRCVVESNFNIFKSVNFMTNFYKKQYNT